MEGFAEAQSNKYENVDATSVILCLMPRASERRRKEECEEGG